MSEQPSSSQPPTSISGQEVKESEDHYEEETGVQQMNLLRLSEPPSGQETQVAEDKAEDNKKTQIPKLERPPLVPTYRDHFLGSMTDVEFTAMRREWDMKDERLTSKEIVEEVLKQPEAVRVLMLKRAFIRRMFVIAVYDECGRNHNKAFNMIRDMCDKKKRKCPVPMKEIEYCFRRLIEDQNVNLNADIDLLLKEEQLRKQMLELPEDLLFWDNLKRKLQEGVTIDCIDFRLKAWNIICSFIDVKIGHDAFFKPFRGFKRKLTDKHHTDKAFVDVLALLEICAERKVTITKLKLTLGDCDWGRKVLEKFLKLPLVCHRPTPKLGSAPSSPRSAPIPAETPITPLTIGTFQLENQKAFLSESLESCININCQELRITIGQLQKDDPVKLYETFGKLDESVQKCYITTQELLPDAVRGWTNCGVWPDFEVTIGLEVETQHKFLQFERTGKEVAVKWNPSVRQSFDYLDDK